MSTTPVSTDGEIRPVDCTPALRRALQEDMIVVPDDPDTASGDHEVMVYSGAERYRVNVDVGHCGCPAFMYHHSSIWQDKHYLRALLALGELDIPDWALTEAIDDMLFRRRAALEGQR